MFITLYVGLLLCGKDGRSVHRAGLGGGYIPRRCTPANSSAPGRTTQHRQQHRPCQMQGRPPTTGRAPPHTPGRWTRCTGLHSIPGRPRRVDQDGAGGWAVCNPSIMCIMIALSQAWYIDSRLYKYHTNALLHLVIVNYYLSIDIPPY